MVLLSTCLHEISQLVCQNIRFFSWCKRHRGADGFDKELGVWRQNSQFPLLCRFMGILGLFKDSDIILKYDDRQDRNLFDFREPRNSAFIGIVL